MTALSQEIEAFHALLESTRAREQRCGALVERALASTPVDPDVDTFDAEEDSLLPPPPRHEKGL